MNHQPIFNRDVKAQVIQTGSQSALLRMTYLAALGLILTLSIIIWGSIPEPVEAKIQSLPETVPLALPKTAPHTEDAARAKPDQTSAMLPGGGNTTTGTPLQQQEQVSLTLPEPDPQQVKDSAWHEITVKRGHSLAYIFATLYIPPQQLQAITSRGGAAHNLKNIYPGQTLRIKTSKMGDLLELHYQIDRLNKLEIRRDGDDFIISTEHKTPEYRTAHASGTITSSLFLAAQKAKLSDALTMELASIFGWDIDFALDIREGDQFTVLYEEQYLDGEYIGNENIFAAEFINKGKKYHAIRYTDNSGKTDFYSLDGKSLRKDFSRTPVDFSRISSRFSLGRKHPILNRIRAHKGVDYAASRGTPIKATGNGKIIHRGKKGGYGNTIIIQHGTRYSTLYAHMSKYRGSLKKGSRVKQGQTIGYVGSSGLATGPHLHYEFRVDGAHRDPLRVKLPGAKPLDKKYLDDFTLKAQALMTRLDLVRIVQIASR